MNKLPREATTSPHAPASVKPSSASSSWSGMESLAEANAEREYRVNALNKQTGKLSIDHPRRKRLLRLSEKLCHCRKGDWCNSPACPMCRRIHRRRWIEHMFKLWPNTPEILVKLKFVTLLHEDWTIPAGKLNSLHPRTITDKLRQQFLRMGFTGAIIGAIDGSFDPDLKVWFVHVHLVVKGLTHEMAKKLHELYPASSDIPKPVMVGKVEDAGGRFSYVLKAFWNLRTRFIDSQGRVNTPEKKQRVPEPHHTEYLLWLDRFAVSDQMLLVGVRRYGGRLRPWGNRQRASASKRLEDKSGALGRRVK